MRRSGLLLLPDLPERAGLLLLRDLPERAGHPIRGIEGDKRAGHPIRGNEGDNRRNIRDLPERAGHNVGRVLVEMSSGINEGDSRSNNNEGVDLDEDNLVIDNNDEREGSEVYLWSDSFVNSSIKQNHNNMWIFTALVCPPNVWPLSITEYNDGTNSEYNDGTDSEDSLPDLEDGDSLPDLELNY